MRVLHIITGLSTGGAETMLRKVLAAMDRSRFEPCVISLLGGGRIGDEIRALGVPVFELGMRRVLPSPAAAYRLLRVVRQFHPEILQGWMYHGNLAAWLARNTAARDAVLLWNIRQSLYDLAREKLVARAVIRFCAWASASVDCILNNSETARSQHEAIGYCDAVGETIPNGFETEIFRPDPAARATLLTELGASESAVLIGLIARYHPMKDHANFLAAAARLALRYPGAHFVLAGTDVDTRDQTLTKAIAAAGLEGRVHLLGERADVAALTAGLDIASSSWGEAFPNVLGEAMSCGVPCVATGVGDAAAIVGDTGRIVPPRDPEALAAAWADLVELGGNERRRLGERARAGVGALLDRYCGAPLRSPLRGFGEEETLNTGEVAGNKNEEIQP